MNREILFKAKRKDNGEWVEGCLIIDYVSGQYFIHNNGNSVNESQKIGEEGCLRFLAFEVNPDTICQFTGLTDKNIWENDIVRNEKGDIGVVQWFEEHAAFMIWNKTKNCVCYLAENDFSKIEVVGNIFDNAELLEVE